MPAWQAQARLIRAFRITIGVRRQYLNFCNRHGCIAFGAQATGSIVVALSVWDHRLMNSRLFFGAGLAVVAGALAFAYYLQYVQGLQPCPLCIFQRIAMAAVGLFCLFGVLHGAGPFGHRLYAALATLAALAGAAIAARHVWLLHLPADQVPACGPGLDYLVDVMPLSEVLATVLRGDASCATVEGAFLGISLPAWTLVGFLALALWLLAGVFGLGPERRRSIESTHLKEGER